MTDDKVCGYTLKERGGIGYCVSSEQAEKWARRHLTVSKVLMRTKLFKKFMKPKFDMFTMVNGDTLELNRNRTYSIGCGRSAKTLYETKYPIIHLSFHDGQFIYPSVSEINDYNFRDLREFCNECGQVVCEHLNKDSNE